MSLLHVYSPAQVFEDPDDILVGYDERRIGDLISTRQLDIAEKFVCQVLSSIQRRLDAPQVAAAMRKAGSASAMNAPRVPTDEELENLRAQRRVGRAALKRVRNRRSILAMA